jgi:5'-3' exonuclease
LVYLIDASVFVFRAWFSLPDSMTDPEGHPVNAVYGYVGFLGDFLRRVRPQHVAVAFDESLTTSFRNDIYPDYKANRELPPPELERQFTFCRQITGLLGMTHFADPRYEADDIIGTISVRMRSCGRNSVIVTRDKDLAQLLRPGDEFWNYVDNRRFAYHEVEAGFGAIPERMADFQALVGDSVDNIPGVPGVGPKTAGALMREFSSLESLFDNLEAVTRLPVRGARGIANRLREHRDTAFLARRLTRIETDMALSVDEKTLSRRRPDLQGLYRLYDELGFGPRMRREAEEIAETF